MNIRFDRERFLEKRGKRYLHGTSTPSSFDFARKKKKELIAYYTP